MLMSAIKGPHTSDEVQRIMLGARGLALPDGSRLEVGQVLHPRWQQVLSLRGRTTRYTGRVHALILFLARLRVGRLSMEGSEDGWAPYDCITQVPGWEQCRDRQRLRETLLHEFDLVTGRFFQRSTLDGQPRLRIAQPRETIVLEDNLSGGDPAIVLSDARPLLDEAPAGRIANPIEAIRRIVLAERSVLACHPATIRAFELLERLARTNLPVLIIGETGVGKENAAFAVHHYSERRDKPFVTLNCAALPESLVETLLFGHDKGAFTGASSSRAGLFETASGGTLFLDEVGELALPMQAKLLRALETKRITRLGENMERVVDLRIVAATNRHLEQEVTDRRFREDLYFRLGGAQVHLAPLRDRACEIPMLFRDFIAQAAMQMGRTPPEPAPSVIQHLLAHRWPGNVRELKHVADFVLATMEGDRAQIEVGDLPSQLAISPIRSSHPTAGGESARAAWRVTHPSTSDWGELAQLAAEAFAEDLGHEVNSWDDTKSYIESYLKPLLFAHLAGAGVEQDAVELSWLAGRIGADRGTVHKQLRRYRERFRR
jgi:DNA-binding NtrC family response regulator